jgi:hypothetical protein
MSDPESATLKKGVADGITIVVGDGRGTCSESTVSIRVRPDGVVLSDSKVLGHLK